MNRIALALAGSLAGLVLLCGGGPVEATGSDSPVLAAEQAEVQYRNIIW